MRTRDLEAWKKEFEFCGRLVGAEVRVEEVDKEGGWMGKGVG